LLLIQSITLTWGKGERGGRAAAARAGFPLGCPVDERAFSGGAAVHSLRFFQQGEEIITADEECRRALLYHLPRQGLSPARVEELILRRRREMRQTRVLTYPGFEDLNLPNLALRPAGDGWAVSFRWDERRGGMPFRRGRNQDYNDPASPFYRRDCLNETAFCLEPGQYGRVVWNERQRDFDDGSWFYQLHAYNIAEAPGGKGEPGLFLREPDFLYRQMAELY